MPLGGPGEWRQLQTCVCSGKHVCAVVNVCAAIRVHACAHGLPGAGRQGSALLGLSAESTKAS